jgi:tripartite ATP-independent transporter DctM subunit
MGESVAALFLAGIVPGVMIGLGLMAVVRLMANKYDLPKAERIVRKGMTLTKREYWASFVLLRLNIGWLIFALFRGTTGIAGGEEPSSIVVLVTFLVAVLASHVLLMNMRGRIHSDFRMVTKRAVVPLQTPILILGGILLGVFTPTEAAAVAVFYAIVVAFFVLKTMTLADLPGVLSRSSMTSAVVLLLVGGAMAFKTVVSLSYAPQILADYVLSLSENPLVLLFLINILLFIVGMFLDAGPAIIILGPILGPIFVDLGVHPVHFAIIMSVNLTVGLATPPMGLVLFVASSVSGEKVQTIARAILPFLAVEVLVIFLITYIPAISMTIPRLTGFVQ